METLTDTVAVALGASAIVVVLYAIIVVYLWLQYLNGIRRRVLRGSTPERIDALRVVRLLPGGKELLRCVTADARVPLAMRASSGAMLAEIARDRDLDLLCEQLRSLSSSPAASPEERRYMRQMLVAGLCLAPEKMQRRAREYLTSVLNEEQDESVRETIELSLRP